MRISDKTVWNSALLLASVFVAVQVHWLPGILLYMVLSE